VKLVLLALLIGGCAMDTTQARVRTAVDARQSRLDNCYAKSLARDDAAAAGKMRLVLHVPKDSDEVEAVDVQHSDLKSKKLQRCVKQVLVGANLGGYADDKLSVEYTLAFRVDSVDAD
jgi:hypothetical protein